MSKAKIFLASIVWLVILAIGVIFYRLWYVPSVEKQREQAQEEVVKATSDDSVAYEHHVQLGLDGFSGYVVLRSTDFKARLREAKIKLETVDDGADYDKRLSALAAGKLQMAAFPIDALLKACAKSKSLPATIVAMIDETRGADALIAYNKRFPTLDALNATDTRYVLVGDSPSDTLTRLLMSSLLGRVNPQAIVPVANEKELINRFRKASADGNEVFVTWEPVVSMLTNEQVKVLFSSKEQSGYLVDALVVNREFLLKNELVVRSVLEAYFRSLHIYNNVGSSSAATQFKELLARDATDAGSTLRPEQIDSLVSGIQWKNTLDNFAHFGLGGNAKHVEDMIDRIRRMLLDTKAMEIDPTQGESSRLFTQSVLREMQASGFHAGASPEVLQSEQALPKLDDQQWSSLIHVATLQVPPLVFARGTATLTGRSEVILDDLAEQLRSFPLYYLTITGNSGSRGDANANRELAKQRATAALQYLQSKGIASSRLRAVSGEAAGEISVTFRLGQMPF